MSFRQQLHIRFATIVGLAGMVEVVLSNVVFPKPNVSDGDTPLVFFLAYLVLFVSFAVGGYLGSRRTKRMKDAIVAGAVTALIIFDMIMVTFVIVDNVWFSIISQQVDKIHDFQSQTHYTNMQAFVNYGLLKGFLVGIPMIAIFGGLFGAIGGVFAGRGGKKPQLGTVTS